MTLPKGWAETAIADITTINPKHPNDTDRRQSVSFVPMPAVDEHLGAITGAVDRPLEEIWTGYTHFADGDVIFAKITPCMENGKAAIASGLTNGLACGSTEFYVLRPQDEIDCRYLWRFLRQDWFRTEAEKHMSGAVGQRRVPRSYLEEYSLPLPPVAEQRRIVARLDALTARIARARAELDRVPMLTSKLRSVALTKAFPVSCEHTSLRKLSEFVTSGSRGWAKYYAESGPFFIRVGNVCRGNISLLMNDVQRVQPPVGSEGTRTAVRPGDVVVTITADLGRVGVIPDNFEPGFVNQHVALVRPFDPDTSRWIGWYLVSDEGQRQMLARDRGVTKAGLGLDDIRDVSIPFPCSQTRQSFVKMVDAIFARADRLEAEAARARALLDRLESAILAKAFRGELVPQDNSDEPASVLLERIRAERAASPRKKPVLRRVSSQN